LIDGICTLANVVIVDPTQAYLVSHAISSRGVAVIMAIQSKEKLYYDQHLKEVFLPLAIEVWTIFYQHGMVNNGH